MPVNVIPWCRHASEDNVEVIPWCKQFGEDIGWRLYHHIDMSVSQDGGLYCGVHSEDIM